MASHTHAEKGRFREEEKEKFILLKSSNNF